MLRRAFLQLQMGHHSLGQQEHPHKLVVVPSSVAQQFTSISTCGYSWYSVELAVNKIANTLTRPALSRTSIVVYCYLLPHAQWLPFESQLKHKVFTDGTFLNSTHWWNEIKVTFNFTRQNQAPNSSPMNLIELIGR